ncbi:MAG: NADP-reducing hydrogenase subunit HndC [Pelotomaculum sp. PtaB.Bin104]|nr:MAG: NADP-reducing hydrogenase subunit HndC [Pelotomaculum sp. PtaB.Bin104]
MHYYRAHVLVCTGSTCVESGCREIKEALAKGIREHHLENEVQLIETGCMGLCDLGPRLIIYPEGVAYCRVQPEDAAEVVSEHLLKGRIVDRLVYRDAETKKPIPLIKDFPFLARQTKIALRNAGFINPEDIEEYIASEGYSALAKALSGMTPAEVISELKKSGLRGRGGAGFSTGLKWEFTANATGIQKYVVCNGDEGDPGAFMDRSVLEGDPHSVIEAMAIAGYAVGADQGYLYIRAEYPLAVERIRHAIGQARLNVGIDYESMAELGAIVGSGGLIVMDEDTYMVDLAKFFTEFCQEESCGKCAPCRIGTKRMLDILVRITQGQGQEGDIETLIELGQYMKNNALCGLGQTAPNPVLSTIRYFRHEYEAHIRDKRCPASVCADLFDSPCQNTCPAGVDAPIYMDHIRNGRYLEAYLEVRRENPFPAVCGRVCDHPCEAKCRRATLDEPIAIRSLKRFAFDWVYEHNDKGFPVEAVAKSTGKQVAVIGGGPAGLTAAYYLAKVGHKVTVYEAMPFAGGMLKVGIPDHRLISMSLFKPPRQCGWP